MDPQKFKSETKYFVLFVYFKIQPALAYDFSEEHLSNKKKKYHWFPDSAP